MFVVATWRDVNMGVLGFVAAFMLGTFFLHLGINDVWKGFPVDLFVTLVGLTYLFGFAQNNGAIEVLVTWSMRLVRGNLALAPWIFFAITAVLMSFGALFAVAIVTPLALGFARRNRINQFMMGLLVVHGALAGAFSPISVYGVFINGFLSKQGFATSPALAVRCAARVQSHVCDRGVPGAAEAPGCRHARIATGGWDRRSTERVRRGGRREACAAL